MVDLEKYEELMEDLKAGRANYLLINVLAKRIRALNEGDRPLVEMETGADPLEIVMEEIRQGKLTLIPRKPQGEKTAAEAPASDEEE